MTDDRTKGFMQALARGLDDALNGTSGPKRHGFVLLVMPFGAAEGTRVNYVSNTDRKDTVAALKEVIARFEGRGHDAPEGRQ